MAQAPKTSWECTDSAKLLPGGCSPVPVHGELCDTFRSLLELSSPESERVAHVWRQNCHFYAQIIVLGNPTRWCQIWLDESSWRKAFQLLFDLGIDVVYPEIGR
jgi:hypothetical protein